jgi:translation initiation factor 2 beta subunit (eIF-2beta)/eIF-5
MAEVYDQEPELPMGGDVAPELPLEAEVPMEGEAPALDAGAPLDIDALLNEIEGAESPVAPVAQQDTSGDMINAMKRARETLAQEDQYNQQDNVTKRFANIEGEVVRLRQERDRLSAQKIRDEINMTINSTVGDELTRLEVDPTTGPGKAFARLLANSAMVAVAKEQTKQGRQDIDLGSVRSQVKNYGKLLERVSSEMATKANAKQRRAAAGAERAPSTPSKPVGEMTDDEFDAAVLAAFIRN